MYDSGKKVFDESEIVGLVIAGIIGILLCFFNKPAGISLSSIIVLTVSGKIAYRSYIDIKTNKNKGLN